MSLAQAALAAVAKSGGDVLKLVAKATAKAVITSKDVEDKEKLVRLIQDHESRLDELERRRPLSWIDFEDFEVTAGDELRLPHNLRGRVRWWVVEWAPATPGDVPIFEKNDDTDSNTLVLDVGTTGTVTLHVRAAG